MYKLLLFMPLVVLTIVAQAQMKVGNNPMSINRDAIFELESTNKGMLLPRVALTATNNVAPLTAHAAGMVVYNTAAAGTGTTAVVPGYYYNNGSGWLKIAQEGSVNLASLSLSNATTPVGNRVGQIAYNTNATSGLPVGPVYWDGTTWVAVNPSASINLYNSDGTLTGARTVTQGANALTFSGAGNLVKMGGDIAVYNGANVTNDGGAINFGVSALPNAKPMSQIKGLLANGSTVESQGGIGFFTRPVGGVFGELLTEKMRLAHDGNVGIGTASPSVRLDVVGTPLANTVNATSSIARFSNPVGNVSFLDITTRRYTAGVDWNGTNSRFQKKVDGIAMGFIDFGIDGMNGSRGLGFGSGTTTNMVVNETGNVGIGTTAPAAKLDVNGYIKLGSSDGLGDITPQPGMIRFSNTTNKFQGYVGGSTNAWVDLN